MSGWQRYPYNVERATCKPAILITPTWVVSEGAAGESGKNSTSTCTYIVQQPHIFRSSAINRRACVDGLTLGACCTLSCPEWGMKHTLGLSSNRRRILGAGDATRFRHLLVHQITLKYAAGVGLDTSQIDQWLLSASCGFVAVSPTRWCRQGPSPLSDRISHRSPPCHIWSRCQPARGLSAQATL